MQLELKIRAKDNLCYVFSEKETLKEAIEEIKENGFCLDKDKNKHFFQEILSYCEVEFNIIDLHYLEIHEEIKTNDVHKEESFAEYVGHIQIKHDIINKEYLEIKDKKDCTEGQFFSITVLETLKNMTQRLVKAIKETNFKDKRLYYIIDRNENKVFNVITQQIGFYKQTKNIAKDYVDYLNENKAVLLTLKEKL